MLFRSGFAGVSGLLLILASIILAGQQFIVPQTTQQLRVLSNTLMMLGASAVTFAVVAVVFARRFGRIPVFRGIMLLPPDQAAEHGSARSTRAAPTVTDSAGASTPADDEAPGPLSIGARGTAISPLRPAGKARFGSRLTDVVTDGEFIERNGTIEVTEVFGNRVVVREIGQTSRDEPS